MSYLAFTDTETTGLFANKHRVIEVCVDVCTHYPEMKTIKRIEYKLKPTEEMLKTAEPKALEINGYTVEKWANGEEDHLKVWAEVFALMEGNIPVGHFIDFDLGFIDAEVGRSLGKRLPQFRNKLDTKAFAYMFGANAGVKPLPWSLGKAHEVTGLPARAAHTAGGDVDMCKDLYAEAMRRFTLGSKV